MSLKDKKIIIGMTGGIACYKVPYLIRSLIKDGAQVRVVMSENATRFITPLTMETISGNPVAIRMFSDEEFVSTRHIDLAQWPDLFLIAPATANFMGKVASGVSDDLLTTIICASSRPMMLAPAMNPQMWANLVTQKNREYLTSLGYRFVGPDDGEMACADWGVGRMVEPEELFRAVSAFFKEGAKKKALSGKKVLVTAGPCREPLDPIRYISNRSSGKMGFALARAAAECGAETTLITGPTNLPPPSGVHFEPVETTQEMYEAVSRRFAEADVLIMAAAPGDFRPSSIAKQKIKKTDAGINMQLEPTIDILKTLGDRKKAAQLLIGFALETTDGLANARRKLKEKNLDLVLLNNPNETGAGFEHDTNLVTVIAPGDKTEEWPLLSKDDLAAKLLDKISTML